VSCTFSVLYRASFCVCVCVARTVALVCVCRRVYAQAFSATTRTIETNLVFFASLLYYFPMQRCCVSMQFCLHVTDSNNFVLALCVCVCVCTCRVCVCVCRLCVCARREGSAVVPYKCTHAYGCARSALVEGFCRSFAVGYTLKSSLSLLVALFTRRFSREKGVCSMHVRLFS